MSVTQGGTNGGPYTSTIDGICGICFFFWTGVGLLEGTEGVNPGVTGNLKGLKGVEGTRRMGVVNVCNPSVARGDGRCIKGDLNAGDAR